MIYLGDQTEARTKYVYKAYCYLNKKLFGSYSTSTSGGYKCKVKDCEICSIGFKKIDLNTFNSFIKPYISEILNVRPENMLNFEAKLILLYVNEGLGTSTDFKNNCRALFKKGYKDWFTNYAINYNLAEWLDQHTCTFCNRQYIFTSRKKDGKKGITCQFDHWYDKGNHPLLSLSFYNLIPSCSLCNSSVKSTSSFNTKTHLHPYVNKDISDSFSFSYKLNTNSEYEICFLDEAGLNEKTKNTLDDLGTKLVYSNHSGKELKDLIDLRLKYSDNYLKRLLKGTFRDLHLSEQEKYRLVFGIEIEEENYHKRPMSKFKKDIITELLSLKN